MGSAKGVMQGAKAFGVGAALALPALFSAFRNTRVRVLQKKFMKRLVVTFILVYAILALVLNVIKGVLELTSWGEVPTAVELLVELSDEIPIVVLFIMNLREPELLDKLFFPEIAFVDADLANSLFQMPKESFLRTVPANFKRYLRYFSMALLYGMVYLMMRVIGMEEAQPFVDSLVSLYVTQRILKNYPGLFFISLVSFVPNGFYESLGIPLRQHYFKHMVRLLVSARTLSRELLYPYWSRLHKAFRESGSREVRVANRTLHQFTPKQNMMVLGFMLPLASAMAIPYIGPLLMVLVQAAASQGLLAALDQDQAAGQPPSHYQQHSPQAGGMAPPQGGAAYQPQQATYPHTVGGSYPGGSYPGGSYPAAPANGSPLAYQQHAATYRR